jgi:protein-arginine kinase activator protein McsA
MIINIQKVELVERPGSKVPAEYLQKTLDALVEKEEYQLAAKFRDLIAEQKERRSIPPISDAAVHD